MIVLIPEQAEIVEHCSTYSPNEDASVILICRRLMKAKAIRRCNCLPDIFLRTGLQMNLLNDTDINCSPVKLMYALINFSKRNTSKNTISIRVSHDSFFTKN